MALPRVFLFSLLGLTLAVCVVSDLRARRIPDAVTWPAMLAALAARLGFDGLGDLEHGVLSGLLGLLVSGGLFGGVALFGKGLGWGDVKLAAVMGVCLGWPLALTATLFVTIAGGLQALISLIWQGALSDTVRRVLTREGKGQGSGGTPPQRTIPYGVAIAFGSAWAMWWETTAS